MLKGRTAIVTGGSRSIGFAIAKELSDQGSDIIICSRTQSELDGAVKKLSYSGRKIFGVACDVSVFEGCQRLIKFTHSQTGRIDILVNNAGIFGPVGPLEINDPEDWKKALEINLLGAVYCSMMVIPYMKKQGSGKIINLAGAGVGGIKPLSRFSAYRTSKTAVVGFTENLAAELQSENIQVNAISPGAVASDLTLGLLKMDRSLVGEDMHKTSKKLQKEGGTSPELAAKLVAFLVSDGANHITGRLLSAKWDKIEDLESLEVSDQNLYRLRRVDNELFVEKKSNLF